MQRRRVGTFWFAFMGTWALLLTLFGAAGLPQAASADPGDPVFELQGEWAPDTPSTVDTEEVVSSTWWFNVNDESKEDHDNRPSNDPLDNVTLTLHSTNAVFDEIPNICMTNDVDPVSDISISSDGKDSTLTCNVGTQDLGTAIKVIAAMSVTGSNDDEVSVTGEFPEGENTVTLDPLTIDNSLFMDLVLVDNADKKPVEGSNRKIFYNWTLYHGKHSPAGPDSVTYTVRVTSHATNDDLPQVNQAVGCQPFTSGGAVAHPWSGGSHPNDQLTAFPTCSLQQISSDPSTGVTTYELTLSNIDYSHAQIPSKDSTGANLPSDRVAIAGGELEFRILTDAPLGSTTIEVDPVTYTSPSGHTAEDDPSNNTSANTWTSGLLGGGWLGGNIADTMRVTPGDEVVSAINMQMRNWNQAFNDELGFCMVLDTKYTEFSSLVFDDYNHNEESLLDRPGVVVQYYTAGGSNGELNPNNSNYNPNAAVGGYRSAATRVCSMDSGSTNWSTTKPADSDIRAVRVLFTPNDVDPATSRPHFKVTQRIKEDVDIGQDIWVWIDSKRHQPGRDDWSGNAPRLVTTIFLGPTQWIRQISTPAVFTPQMLATLTQEQAATSSV